MDVYGVDYPASYEFSRGFEGVIDATRHIESIAANCPRTNSTV
jgi:cutinase